MWEVVGMASDRNVDDLPDNTTHVLVPCNLRQHSRLRQCQLETRIPMGSTLVYVPDWPLRCHRLQ